METQALMRILQLHRTVQRHQHGFGSATANNMNEFHQDYSGLVRGVLQVGLVQPSTLAIPGGFEQLQLILFERLRQARIDLELSRLGYSQLVFHPEFAVPQDDRLQSSFYESLARPITGQISARLLGDHRANFVMALPGTLTHRDPEPAIMCTANNAFSLLPIQPLQNVPLTEHVHSRQSIPPDMSRINRLRLPHEEPIRPFNDNIFSYSSNTDVIPVTGPESFPMVLHRALLALENNPRGASIAAFLADGLSFRIQNRVSFEQKVIVAFFPRMKGYASFQRQLNLYGFRRCMDGRYWHEYFARHDPALLTEMRRRKVKRNRISGKTQAQGNDDFEEDIGWF